jgi:hypothetical protein
MVVVWRNPGVSKKHITSIFRVPRRVKPSKKLAETDPEDGGDIFLRNVGISPYYMAL